MPRHPPCALHSLSHKHNTTTIATKMLASTMQISNNKPTHHQPHTSQRGSTKGGTKQPDNHPHHTGASRPDPSGPNSVPTTNPPSPTHQVPHPHHPPKEQDTGSTETRQDTRAGPSSTIPLVNTTIAHHTDRRLAQGTVLLRKEVIQPHLPVRLPCYDFVPIASPTFDGSLPQGVRPPASGVADFRDVTGGVYKARERIHRSVADLRLLATPTSWGRVADPNPN